MCWFRIDNRLVHGQVIEAWLPYTGASCLVVANDAVSDDDLQQQIMSLAIPNRIAVHFLALDAVHTFLTKHGDCADVFVLFADANDVEKAFRNGVAMDVLNVGNMHYGPGKKQLYPHVALSAEDTAHLSFLQEQGVMLDFRCVPNDTAEVREL